VASREPASHPYSDRFALRPGRDAADKAVIHRYSAEMRVSGRQCREDDDGARRHRHQKEEWLSNPC
jgi:hypothetical protein